MTMEYDTVLPVRIYGLRGEERNYLLGPFAYGSLDSKDIKAYMRRRKIEDFPRVQIRESLLAANLILNGIAGGAYSSPFLSIISYCSSSFPCLSYTWIGN